MFFNKNVSLNLFWLLLIHLVWFSVPGSAQTLSVTTGVPSITIHPGDTNVPVSVNLGSGTYSGPVSVTLSGLPSGITVAPLTLTPGGSGALQLTASRSADQEDFPANDAGNADTATHTVSVLAFTDSQQATASLSLTVSLHNPSYSPSPDKIDLPIVNINTSGVAIPDKTTNIPGTITITSADGQTSYLPSLANPDNSATFQLHGNSSLRMPKKSYRVKLNTSTDLLTAIGLSCPYVTGSGKAYAIRAKTYVLLANYDDKSLLRDWSASALANSIPNGTPYLSYSPGSPSPTGTSALGWWAPHSLFVELYLNGEYQGNYQLIEAIKIDSHRLNINEMKDTDISGNGTHWRVSLRD